MILKSLEAYKKRFGKYPKNTTGDGIFGNRANREIVKELKIRGGFRALGKAAQNKNNKQWFRKKQRLRGNLMEGIIGNGKNYYGLNKILYTIPDGEEIWTRMCLAGMNLTTALRLMANMEAKAIQA